MLFRELSANVIQKNLLEETSVSDPDSIGSVDPDPDPRGQILPTKMEKVKTSHV
jgi:hypothetical protein